MGCGPRQTHSLQPTRRGQANPAVGGLLFCTGFVICSGAILVPIFTESIAPIWIGIGGALLILFLGIAVMVVGHRMLNFGVRKGAHADKSPGLESPPGQSDASKP